MLNIKLTKKAKIWSAVTAVLILAIIIFSGGDDKNRFDTAIAERGDLVQEVSLTGRVVAAESVDLAFEKTGKVAGVFAYIGDFKARGEILIRLQNDDIAAQLAQAEANVKIQEAKLIELNRGSREEEIEIQKVKVLNTENSLQEAETNLVDTLADSFTKSDDAIRNKIDQFFSNPQSLSPDVNFFISSQNLKNTIENRRVDVEILLDNWQEDLIGLNTDSVLSSHVTTTKNNFNSIKSFLDNVALAVNSAMPSSSLTQATIDGYKTDVSTARTNVNTAISNLSTSEEKLRDAESALLLAEKELILKEAGTASEQIAAQVAKVEESKASVANYYAQLVKTIMRSPISGVVTKQEAKVGEIVTAGSKLVSIISASQLEIEMNVPEADIAKLALQNKASVTLDAYRDEIVFEALVSFIEPAETIIEGVATYKTILQFVDIDDRIKSGMTANVDLLTNKREDVIYVPTRSILTKNGQKIVRVVDGDSFKEVVVEVGLRGTDGNTEIVSGISEGDVVIVFIKE